MPSLTFVVDMWHMENMCHIERELE